jgi:hypothetical protein
VRPIVAALFAPVAALAAISALGTAELATPVQARAEVPARPIAGPPPGAIPIAFWNNQLLYCSIICPYMIQGLVEVPLAVLGTPGVYADAVESTQSVPRSQGIAAASVTGPANAAMTGMIVNDLTLVLPRAQNTLEVAVVEAMKVADVATDPTRADRQGAVGAAFDTGRTRIVDALDQPVRATPPQAAVPATAAQSQAIAAIEAGSALLFQAPEWLLLGAIEIADAAATEMAAGGDVDAALAAGNPQSSEAVIRAADAWRLATGK